MKAEHQSLKSCLNKGLLLLLSKSGWPNYWGMFLWLNIKRQWRTKWLIHLPGNLNLGLLLSSIVTPIPSLAVYVSYQFQTLLG